jgi:hypothetical protein
MDKTLQAAQEADTLRQQHSKQLVVLQTEQQQQVEGMAAAAAAAQEAHQQVRQCVAGLLYVMTVAGNETVCCKASSSWEHLLCSQVGPVLFAYQHGMQKSEDIP